MSTQINQASQSSMYRVALILTVSLTFMWGMAYGLNDVLSARFQESIGIDKFEAGLIQASYFLAYFIMAMPAALFMEKYGYKLGIIGGLTLFAIGSLLTFPAISASNFWFFLTALFVLACGVACLETAANPYILALGDSETSERRLNLAQSFNGLGTFLAPLIGATFIFGSGDTNNSPVQVTYLAIAVVAILLLILIARTRMPDIRETGIAVSETGQSVPLMKMPHFVHGVIAQFVYTGAQVGSGAFFITLAIAKWPGASTREASVFLSIALAGFMAGRFISTVLMRWISPHRLLGIYGLINVVLSALVVIGIPYVSIIALIATFIFMSIMSPTTMALGLKDLGEKTKRGTSLQIMAVIGASAIPLLMGLVAREMSVELAYAIPVVCFAYVGWYGWKGSQLMQRFHLQSEPETGA
ncbi:sugar MFS transporter [Citrobacter farmeri]|uniref:sugar MFS transporter n=1 Tax=Citrobacter farmeri TaxID=67824 RepID=UPI0019044FD8|nr:sugar MFS transporter [Citrobacter farmeri]EKV7297232.1 sugar MFS transporter [Citrobacter farmeri]MBJ9017492.1 sugar MFS transporter [Citrobacter farmeri]